ncbi:MAG: serine hydrolase [Clostridia bacterium]|nr:serine hydrolase [Clostridia bacterium]
MSFESELENYLETHKDYDKLAISIEEINGDYRFYMNENDLMPTASTMKLFVLGALLKKCERGEENLGRFITIQKEKMYPGSGILRYLSDGIQLTIKDLLVLMVILSDNSATNLCIDIVGGLPEVNAHIHEIGVENASVNRKVYDNSPNPEKKRLADVSPRAYTDYLRKVRMTDFFSKEYKDLFFSILEDQKYKDMFARYMPLDDFTEDGTVRVMSKTGFSGGVRADTGVMVFANQKEYAYAIMVSGSKDTSYSFDNATHLMMADIGKMFYENFGKLDFAGFQKQE